MPPLTNKPGSLGRSLGDLMSGLPQSIGSAATLSTNGFMRLSPDRIRLQENQDPNTVTLPDSFLDSVRTHGILQPLLIRKTGDGYELVAGARRLAAARQLELSEVPVIVVQASGEEAALISQVENSERRNPATPPVPVREVLPAKRTSPWRHVATLSALATLVGTAIWAGWSLSNRFSEPSPHLALAPNERPSLLPSPAPVPPPEKRPAIDPAEFQGFTPDQIVVDTVENKIRIVFQRPVFASRTTLDDSQRPLLRELAAILARHADQCTLLITGHTDAIPIRGSKVYRDNHDLGLARASETARFLWREAGLPVAMLNIATAGSDAPPFPSDSPESARRNRTVTLLITPVD